MFLKAKNSPTQHEFLALYLSTFSKHKSDAKIYIVCSGGVVSTLLLHPLDLLKIRFAGKQHLYLVEYYYEIAITLLDFASFWYQCFQLCSIFGISSLINFWHHFFVSFLIALSTVAMVKFAAFTFFRHLKAIYKCF